MDKNPNTVLAALKALLTAVTYNAPPVDFGKGEPNLCYEARVPVGFVEEAQAAIAAAEQAHAAKDSPTLTADWRMEAMSRLTAEAVDAGAQRLVSFEDGCVWPDSWGAGQVAQARVLAERCIRSALCVMFGEAPHHHEAGGAPGREAVEHLVAALDICTRTSSRQWPAAESVGYHIAEALGLPDHDLTRDQALALLSHPPSDQQGREQVIGELCEALEAIRQYGSDTLSGRADGGPDDRAWQRAAVVEMTKRARAAVAKARGEAA